jgi:hypothetical protein
MISFAAPAFLNFTKPLGSIFRMNHYFLLRDDDDAGAICEIGFPPISIHSEL